MSTEQSIQDQVEDNVIDIKALAIRTIELRNEGTMGALAIVKQVAQEFDISLPEFSLYYEQATREYYDELSKLSNLPLAAYFKLFARNKHGAERHVGYAKATSYDDAIDKFCTTNEPFFFDKEDMRAEVLQDMSELTQK